MIVEAPRSYLELYLAPLRSHLSRPDVTDIYINKPGEMWVESRSGRIERFVDPALDAPFLWRLASQVASQSHQGMSRRHPLLAATLPDGSRVQIVAPPATRGDISISIRRHLAGNLALGAFQPSKQVQRSTLVRKRLQTLIAERDYSTFLSEAVQARMNIVVSGGTSAGKTTLLNALLEQIPPTERLIAIEDAPELRLNHENAVGLIAVRGDQGEASVSSIDLLEAALRMRPDRIILGELRGAEAFTFLRAVNTGHPGSLTTVHADNPKRAIVQLAMMSLQAGLALSFAETCQLVKRMVDVVVQVARVDGRREIDEITFVGPDD